MNPYEVLGVSENADEETIKKAYRELVKKYHPDKYVNNPLSDLAGEKIKEINKAYDMLTNKHTSVNGTDNSRSSSGNYSTNGQASFQSVRMLITQSRILEARTMLASLPKTAEWYYLSGIIGLRMGWYDQAISFLQTAVNMEPNNVEYRNAYENVRNRNQTYTTTTSRNTTSSGCCDPCNCCTACMCVDCICPCY